MTSNYEKLCIEQIDAVNIKVHCERGLAMELNEHLTFSVPGARFMPAFKNKVWDGKIRLFNTASQTTYAGLYNEIKQFAKQRDYGVEDVTDFSTDSFSVVEANEFIKTLSLPFEVRDYQLSTFIAAVRNKRNLFVSPTASGKSLIIYLIQQYLNKRTLIVVPTTSLVHQLRSDFKQYGMDVDTETHVVFSGQEKDTDKRVVITTWQSVYNLKKPWFQQFDAVIGDEAHLFKATSLTTLMTKLTRAFYRFGFTGSLDGSMTHELVLQGIFGEKREVATTTELIEKNYLSEFRIKAIVLKHEEQARELLKKATYKEELHWLVQVPKRNKFIRNLALSLKGNTLILYQFVEKQGKPLYEDIVAGADDQRKVFFIHGKVDGEDRNDVRYIVEQEDDSIIVASYGTFSTGINIPRIHNVIFASPFKSKIRALQSIGRVLRKGENKDKATLFDIADDLTWKSRKNHGINHFMERVAIYDEQKFDYKIYTVSI